MRLALHVKENMMNKQLATVLATVSLLVVTSGCSGMKNFLFGRGAACGSCGSANAGNTMAPPEAGCGYEPTCGHEGMPAPQPRSGCRLFNGKQTCNAGPNCECGGSTGAYMPSNVDYYGGEVHDPYAYGGEVIGSEVMGNGYNGYPVQGQVVPDNFDTRGGIITSPAPVTGGSVLQPN
jgi:hypothetical protein